MTSAAALVCCAIVVAARADDGGTRVPVAPRTAPIEFEDACDAAAEVVTLSFMGDVLLHTRIQEEIYALPEGAQSLFGEVQPLIEAVDFAVANQETVLSCCTNPDGESRADPGRHFDDDVYTSHTYRGVVAAPFVAAELRAVGLDALTTSNNHAFDRHSYGVKQTVQSIRSAGMVPVGTREDDAEPWERVIEVRGLRLALLGCTQRTNGKVDDPEHIRYCFDDGLTVLDDIAELSLRADLDGVILLPHAGENLDAGPEPGLVGFARAAVDAGALAVIVTGRHEVQGWEQRKTADGRTGLIMYSLGDAIAHSSMIDPVTSIMAIIGVARGASGKAVLRGAQAIPLFFPIASMRRPRSLQVLDRASRFIEERALVASRIGEANLIDGREPLSVTPQCEPGYIAPPPFIGSVGDGCGSNADCAPPLTCTSDFFDRICSRACDDDTDCLAQPGRAPGACASGPRGEAMCLASCDRPGRCRVGFECASTIGVRGARCVPVGWAETTNQSTAARKKK